MERAFAYLSAPENLAPRLLKKHCRKIYELGYIPICPQLSLPQYLNADNSDDNIAIVQISLQLLRRCRMLVVCAAEASGHMTAELALAQKLNLICTTLDGLIQIKESSAYDTQYS